MTQIADEFRPDECRSETNEDCECPLCLVRARERMDYYLQLGAALGGRRVER